MELRTDWEKIKFMNVQRYRGINLEIPIKLRVRNGIYSIYIEVTINKELRVIRISEFNNLLEENLNNKDKLFITPEDYIIFKRAFFNQPRQEVIEELDRLYVMAKL